MSKMDYKRNLLIEGAYSSVSLIAERANLKNYLEKLPNGNTTLAQAYSPYLPSSFFDEFADKEPTTKQLICANVRNFADSLGVLELELSSKQLTDDANIVHDIQNCMKELYEELKQEIQKEITPTYEDESLDDFTY